MFEFTQSVPWSTKATSILVNYWSAVPKYLAYLGLMLGIAGIAFSVFTQFHPISQVKATEKQVCLSQVVNTNVTVYVSGAVQNPGVYQLASSSRVADAIQSAGGLTEQVDSILLAQKLNLAAFITDEQHIHLPVVGEFAAPVSAASPSSTEQENRNLISINSASYDQLTSLPKIGQKTAEKIIAGRPYQSLEDLVNKKIVSQSVLTEIKSKLTY